MTMLPVGFAAAESVMVPVAVPPGGQAPAFVVNVPVPVYRVSVSPAPPGSWTVDGAPFVNTTFRFPRNSHRTPLPASSRTSTPLTVPLWVAVVVWPWATVSVHVFAAYVGKAEQPE